MTSLETLIMVLIFALTTLGTRAIAFAAFPPGRPTPRFVVYLGRVLPFAITSMLIVYCLRNTPVFSYPHGIPELLAIILVAAIFLIFKNSLAAISVGTIVYMLLVQLVFTG